MTSGNPKTQTKRRITVPLGQPDAVLLGDAGDALPLNRPLMIVGSAAWTDIAVPGAGVVAVIVNADGQVLIRRIDPDVHLSIDGRPVDEGELRNGCVLQIGAARRQVSMSGESRAAGPLTPLSLEVGEQQRTLSRRIAIVGTGSHADVIVAGDNAAESHALLIFLGGYWLLADLRSPAGSLVNGRRVRLAECTPGLRIGFGSAAVRVSEATPREALAQQPVTPVVQSVSSEVAAPASRPASRVFDDDEQPAAAPAWLRQVPLALAVQSALELDAVPEEPQPVRRRLWLPMTLVLILAGIGVAAFVWMDQIRAWLAI